MNQQSLHPEYFPESLKLQLYFWLLQSAKDNSAI